MEQSCVVRKNLEADCFKQLIIT